jgi:hypothetical protein
VALGDPDDAFKRLDQAFVERSGYMTVLWWHIWDPIRSDPRFEALEARVAVAAGKAPRSVRNRVAKRGC